MTATEGGPRLVTSRQAHEEFGYRPKALAWWARGGGLSRVVGQDGLARYDRAELVAFLDLTAGKTLLTQADVAALFLVDTRTVSVWEKDGHLTRLPSRPGGGFPRYDAAQVHAFLGEIPPTEKLLTPGAAAVLIGVTPNTLATFADFGCLAYARTPGGHHRYPETAVRELADTRRRTR